MKHILFSFIIFAVYLNGAVVSAAQEFFRTVQFPISSVFVPEGFDNNDSVQIMVKGEFPNNCFQMGKVDAEPPQPDDLRIVLGVTAYEYSGDCSSYPVPFHQVVRVGLLSKIATYGIYDRKSENYLGAIKIDPPKAAGAGTDNLTYAPLHDAYLTKENGKTKLVLTGEFTSSCLGFAELQVIPQKNVVVVLPGIAPRKDEVCKNGLFPFTQQFEVKEKLPDTKYLLHVRAIGGESINKIVIP